MPIRLRHAIRPAAAALIATAICTLPAMANAQGNLSTPRLLTMSGNGEERAAPDMAQLSLGVVSEAVAASTALADNAKKMNAVFAAIRKAGIPDKAIQTSNISVSPQYPSYSSKQEQHIIGYQVSNTVTVTVHDLKRLGATLDALVAAGANTINGVSFSIRNPDPLLAKAREAAVKDATEKASIYANAAGVTLGPIQSITESQSRMPRPLLRAMALSAAAPTPIAAGEETVSVTVTMSWQLR